MNTIIVPYLKISTLLWMFFECNFSLRESVQTASRLQPRNAEPHLCKMGWTHCNFSVREGVKKVGLPLNMEEPLHFPRLTLQE